MRKFSFTDETKTEIRHNVVPEFLIDVMKINAAGWRCDRSGA